MKKLNKKIYISIICILTIGIIGILIFFGMQSKNTEELDYSLVFDYLYYADSNQDIRNSVGLDEKTLLEHFINYGMPEGRRGSMNFYANYYRENNEDLWETFGDDWASYYEHYIKYGYNEGRKGSNEDFHQRKPEIDLVCQLKNSDIIIINIDYNNKKYSNKLYLLELPAYKDDVNNSVGRYDLNNKKLLEINMKSITDKFVVVSQNEDGSYECVSNIAYIQNPENACQNLDNQTIPKVNSKKGLQVQIDSFDDVNYLEPSYVFVNIYLQKLLLMNYEENNTIEYEYQGKTYYFNKKNIQKYDRIISEFTNQGRFVISSILNMKQDGFECLYYPDISMDTDALLYAINTSDEVGQMYFEAAVDFISSRYNGTNQDCGYVGKWVIGNEVNESGTYNYMGEKNINDYLDEYTRTFRIAYNIIKSNNLSANIYLPEEPFWGIDSVGLTYGGREFLNIFNTKIKENGNIDWGLAYHAYSYPLCDPKVLNDDIPLPNDSGEFIKELITKDSFYTPMITMKNLDVLTDFMKQKSFLTSTGNVRSIILSEQGYTSNSNVYGKCEALQAASIVYAYYKTEMNPNIEAFVYFLQKDDEKASMGNDFYQFGLSQGNNDNIVKKISHEVYRDMDKKDSLENLSFIKEILGISNWNEVIDNFDKDIFKQFENSQEDGKDKIDLSNVKITNIENQKYTGEECLPDVTVEYEGRQLISDVDYDVVYFDNVNIGQATALIVGMGDFTGTQKVEFKVEE